MPAPLERFAFGDFILDVSGRSLTRRGAMVPLRRKSFQVLDILVQNRSRVVTKAELLDQVWGIAVSEEVLTGCVREVRRALGDDRHSAGMIRTVHGEGYQFVGAVREVPATEEQWTPPGPGGRVRGWAGWLVGIGVVAAGLAGWVWWSTPAKGPRAAEVPQEVGWWRFDEAGGRDAIDSSGHGNVGRLQRGVERAPGVLGAALSFDGQTGFVLADGPGLGFPAGDSARTVTGWLKPGRNGDGDRNILQWGNSVADPPRATFHLFLEDGRLGWGNGYGQDWLRSTESLDEGDWRHVAAVYSGAPSHRATLYVDGQMAGETNAPLLADTKLEMPWRMGVFQAGGTPFQGLMDDIRLFPVALTPTWVQALHSCGARGNRFHSPLKGDVYWVPTGQAELTPGPDGALENRKERFGAAQLALFDGVCAMKDLRGAAMPESYRLTMEVELPKTGPEQVLSAGPTVLAEETRPGGMAQRGYWVAVGNDGTVVVKALGGGGQVVASWRNPGGFDASRAHGVSVSVDGQLLGVELDGVRVMSVPVPAGGGRAVGVAFASGGTPLHNFPQRVRGIRLASH